MYVLAGNSLERTILTNLLSIHTEKNKHHICGDYPVAVMQRDCNRIVPFHRCVGPGTFRRVTEYGEVR